MANWGLTIIDSVITCEFIDFLNWLRSGNYENLNFKSVNKTWLVSDSITNSTVFVDILIEFWIE